MNNERSTEISDNDPESWYLPNGFTEALFPLAWLTARRPTKDGVCIVITEPARAQPVIGPKTKTRGGYVSIAPVDVVIGTETGNAWYRANLVVKNSYVAEELMACLSAAIADQKRDRVTTEPEPQEGAKRYESFWGELQDQWGYPTVIGLHAELGVRINGLRQLADRIEETLDFLPRDLQHESSINGYNIDLESALGERIQDLNRAYTRQILNSVREAAKLLENAYEATLARYST